MFYNFFIGSDFNRLECSDIDQSCKAVERSSSNDTLPQQVPLHLLMVSILELVCQNYIHDPVKAELLFKGLNVCYLLSTRCCCIIEFV